MLVAFFETPAGYALFKVLDDNIINDDPDMMAIAFRTADDAKRVVQLVDFKNFADITNAVDSTMEITLGLIPEPVHQLLAKLDTDSNSTLLVADQKLGLAITESLGIPVLCNSGVFELFRCIRSRLSELLSTASVTAKELGSDMNEMSVILAHNLAQRKMQTNPNSVDSMLKHGIGLHDAVVKKIQIYIKRFKAWYGAHFPELALLVKDDMTYLKTMSLLWHRCNIDDTDFSSVLAPAVEKEVRYTAKMSTGAEIGPPEFPLLNDLADEIVDMIDWKNELESYLDLRMSALAPNVTALVGSLIGARLIKEAGSLLALSKKPASAISLYGARKALFSVLSVGSEATPKHGHIFTSKFVQEAEPAKNKGKISRALACKIALAVRVDSFGEGSAESTEFASASVAKIEARIKRLHEEILIREIKENEKAPAVELTAVAVDLVDPEPINALPNNRDQNETKQRNTFKTVNVKNFILKRRRGNGLIASSKRSYERLVRTDKVFGLGGGAGAPIAVAGVKRSYETSSRAPPVRNFVGENLARIVPSRIKFCEAKVMYSGGSQIDDINLSR